MGTDQEPQNLPFPLSYSHSGFYDEHCAKHDTKLIWKIVNTPLRITVYPAWQKLAVYVEVWLHKSGECARGLSITLKEYSCRSSLCLLYKVCCIQAVLSHIFLLPCSMFSFFVGAFIFLREHCRAWSLCPLSYVFCNVPPPPLSHFLSFPIDGCCSPPSPSFLHHPLALSLPFCSLCARSLSWALTSHYDPSCGDFGTQYSLLGRSQCRGYKYELQTFSL